MGEEETGVEAERVRLRCRTCSELNMLVLSHILLMVTRSLQDLLLDKRTGNRTLRFKLPILLRGVVKSTKFVVTVPTTLDSSVCSSC